VPLKEGFYQYHYYVSLASSGVKKTELSIDTYLLLICSDSSLLPAEKMTCTDLITGSSSPRSSRVGLRLGQALSSQQALFLQIPGNRPARGKNRQHTHTNYLKNVPV